MAGKLREINQEIKDAHREYSMGRGMDQDQTQLLNAVRKRNVSKLEKILSRGVDPLLTDQSGCPLLHMVAQSNPNDDTIGTLKTLLYFGADPEACDRFGRTSLHVAVHNSSKLVTTLLEAGCSSSRQDNAGRTPLMEACSSESVDALVTVSILLDRQSNVLLKDEDGLTALHCVCQNRKQDLSVRNEITLKLLYAGLSATVNDRRGRIPLCYELDRFVERQRPKESQFTVVKTLIHAGSRFNARNKLHEHWVKSIAIFSNVHFLMIMVHISVPMVPLSTLKKLHILTKSADVIGDDEGMFHVTLKSLTRTVRPLKEMSRIVIREVLKGKIFPSVSLLPLPTRLQNYITCQ